MIHKKRVRKLGWAAYTKRTKRWFKKKFKKEITVKEIKKIWDDWIRERIINKVIEGEKVEIDNWATIELVGKPVLEDKRFFNLLLKGQSMRKNGTIKKANLNLKRKEFIFKIVYRHKSRQSLYFSADPKFSKMIHDAIVNKNYYYRIDGIR